MRTPTLRLAAAATLTAAAVAVAAAPLTATAETPAPGYTVTTDLHLAVDGPGQHPTGTCDIVADLYVPHTATPESPAPAIVTSHGFGGSKSDQAGIGALFASRGYVVLAYSARGFGGSACTISLDDPALDGVVSARIADHLAGLGYVALDRPGDPVVGFIGASYGGQAAFAAQKATADAGRASYDALVPIITWNDLTYSLSPNNTSRTGTGVSTAVPGAAKLLWALGFSGLGVADGLANAQADPYRFLGCPDFVAWVCPALATAATFGTVDAPAIAAMRQASVASYLPSITAPTLLVQGQSDTLFNLNEAVATYQALQAQGTEVKMTWFNGGHSGPAAPGELDLGSPDPATQHVTRQIVAWFDHHLKGLPVDTGPEFSYFRDWVSYSGIATPAYGSAASYPVGSPRTFYLSGDRLVTSPSQIVAARPGLLTPGAGLPTSTDLLDVVGSALPLPEVDVPGTYAQFVSAPLPTTLDVVGSPTLDLTVTAPTARLTQGTDGGRLVLFVKISEVDPTGRVETVRNLVAPVRVPDVTKPFRVTLPAFVHRFDAGNHLRLVVSGGSTNYRGGLVPTPVNIVTGSPTQALTLPVVP